MTNMNITTEQEYILARHSRMVGKVLDLIEASMPEGTQCEKFKKLVSTINIPEYFTNKIFGQLGGTGQVQWMVFKVKQRAAKDYSIFSKQCLTKDQPIVPASITSPYTFIWPYDYFSLV